jgi:hypothetical protein
MCSFTADIMKILEEDSEEIKDAIRESIDNSEFEKVPLYYSNLKTSLNDIEIYFEGDIDEKIKERCKLHMSEKLFDFVCDFIYESKIEDEDDDDFDDEIKKFEKYREENYNSPWNILEMKTEDVIYDIRSAVRDYMKVTGKYNFKEFDKKLILLYPCIDNEENTSGDEYEDESEEESDCEDFDEEELMGLAYDIEKIFKKICRTQKTNEKEESD